jgi:hypothetical protein
MKTGEARKGRVLVVAAGIALAVAFGSWIVLRGGPRSEFENLRQTTANDPEVRQLFAVAAESPLRQAEFGALSTEGSLAVIRLRREERRDHWASVEVSLITTDRHGWHEWNFGAKEGRLTLLCESMAAYGPNVWRFEDGPAREKVYLASGTGGACVEGTGFTAAHLESDGLKLVPIDRAVALAGEWRKLP